MFGKGLNLVLVMGPAIGYDDSSWTMRYRASGELVSPDTDPYVTAASRV